MIRQNSCQSESFFSPKNNQKTALTCLRYLSCCTSHQVCGDTTALPCFTISPQVCRGWNQAFHMPELWRCFEFELNQPASSYLRATHPDLIKQIIKRHANHLQYVSFKVDHVNRHSLATKRSPVALFETVALTLRHSPSFPRWTAAESRQKRRATSCPSL